MPRANGTLPERRVDLARRAVQRASAGAREPRPSLRHRPDQRDHARPRLEQHGDLPKLGRLGRILRSRRAAAASTRTATALRVPGIVISPYARRGFIDHQTLSHDAYVKFIEDDFLGGERIDPKTDGRPDRRPTVRENVPILGDLRRDFDFRANTASTGDSAWRHRLDGNASAITR